MNDKQQFTLYNSILDFNSYVRKYVAINIPVINRDLRIHLMDECYNLTKDMFNAVYNKGNIRMKYLISIRVDISLIDMLLFEIKNLKCQKDKYIVTSISKLEDVKIIIYGWIKNEESKKK